tara:strand:+ start:234 stop:473 length:240 start_codon:yes stop_codon:yes gene_type:complete
MKLDFPSLASLATIGVLSWGALQLYELKSDTAVISYQVGENYDMIKPMWQDFLVRSASQNEYQQNIHSVPDIQASRGKD